MPLLGSSFLIGRQNTQPHCSGTFTGYAYRSESSFGCILWHITVCMAQHRRILQTACGRHQTLSSVAIFALPTRLRCWCRQLSAPATIENVTIISTFVLVLVVANDTVRDIHTQVEAKAWSRIHRTSYVSLVEANHTAVIPQCLNWRNNAIHTNFKTPPRSLGIYCAVGCRTYPQVLRALCQCNKILM